ncbi:hypothetical protein AC579_6703 [Pseudocercospora musae]|uniref:Uncharacterized protein n=1 Tax=Pseudocercospora musae TaxID=113226 RepID=A0A139IHL6_9PEZI|nr:hypothetical protein AC579_6703 [Pseudocercospora musae]
MGLIEHNNKAMDCFNEQAIRSNLHPASIRQNLYALTYDETLSLAFRAFDIPPAPSITFPVPLSVTVTCSKAPSTESITLPAKPAITKSPDTFASIVTLGSVKKSPIPATNVSNPLPSTLYFNPSIVTPPFVPFATFFQGAVIITVSPFDKIPSSDANVSAATAAYCAMMPIGSTWWTGEMPMWYAWLRIRIHAQPEFAQTWIAFRAPSPPVPPVEDCVSQKNAGQG